MVAAHLRTAPTANYLSSCDGWLSVSDQETDEWIDSERAEALRAEIDDLTAEADVVEAELASMREALDQFEMRYRQLIAGRLAKVEALDAQLAALRGHHAAEAFERAEAAARVAEELTPRERYRALAKRLHPDLHRADPELAAAAEELTKRLTAAWKDRDMDEIDRIEAEAELRFPGAGSPAQRVRLLSRLRERLGRQIDAARGAIAEMRGRALWMLFERSEEAKEDGRDLLAEQAEDLDEAAAMLQAEIDLLEQGA